MSNPQTRRWTLAWAALCVAFAIHVIDEAANDFLAWFNPNAMAIRESIPWLPIPVFTFRSWIIALVVAISILSALTPLVRRGHRWLIPVAYAYGVVHVLNGVAHIVVSLVGGTWMPGVLSAPLVLGAGVWLLHETQQQSRLNQRVGA